MFVPELSKTLAALGTKGWPDVAQALGMEKASVSNLTAWFEMRQAAGLNVDQAIVLVRDAMLTGRTVPALMPVEAAPPPEPEPAPAADVDDLPFD